MRKQVAVTESLCINRVMNKGAEKYCFMEKVFDMHIHYSFDMPLKTTIEIFKEEFSVTHTQKGCFLSLPHQVVNGVVSYDETQNIKALYLKKAFAPDFYAFAGLIHPQDHSDEKAVAKEFLRQAETYFSVGYDGMKMLEGYPSLLKAWGVPLDSKVYDDYYAFMEENGYPIILHIANPEENWNITQASLQAIQAGRVYDGSYPTKAEITAQVFRVLEKYPRLKLTLAHFGFMSYDVAEAERFMSYPNTLFDTTPGGEQLINMSKSWEQWLPFWEKYQDRILYGTDYYAFPKDDHWETAFQRRPKFLRQFLETDTKHDYLGEKFRGVKLDERLLQKICWDNAERIFGKPKKIDEKYLFSETEKIFSPLKKTSTYADEDLRYIKGCFFE